MYGFGNNDYGQCGLLGDKKVFTPTEITGLNGKTITSIAGGDQHTIALSCIYGI